MKQHETTRWDSVPGARFSVQKVRKVQIQPGWEIKICDLAGMLEYALNSFSPFHKDSHHQDNG